MSELDMTQERILVQRNLCAQTVDVVWVEDDTPAGANKPPSTEPWTWISNNPAPFSGRVAHQSQLIAGIHQHFFDSVPAGLPIFPEDRLFAYIYIDSSNPPEAVMLQWNDGEWEHRAYWG